MSFQHIYSILPIALLGVGSVALLLAGAFFPGLGRARLNLAGAAVALVSAVVAAFYSPPVDEVGGLIGAGRFEAMFSVISGLAAFVTLLLSVGYTARRPLGDEEYPSLVLFAAFGMDLLGSAVSLLGIFLGLECMSLALYVLLASNRSDPKSGEAGLKYLLVGAVSTAFLAFGLALIYAASGSLAVDAALRAAFGGQMRPVALAGWGLVVVGLGFKASLFPFHLWAPDVYDGGPAPVVAFLSTGSKAAVFAAFLRLVTSSPDAAASISPALWVMAAATMAFGNIAALTQDNVKRLLAYSSIAQMGYVLLALMAAPEAGPTAVVFYLLVYIAMDLGAFGVVASLSGPKADLTGMDSLKGLGYTHPFRSVVLALCMLSLAGMPPTAGFAGKFMVFFSAIKAGYVYLAVFGIATAAVSVYYYLRVIVYLYMRPPDKATAPMPGPDPAGQLALGMLAAAILALGVAPGGALELIAAIAVFTAG